MTINFKQVTFAYEDASRPILQDASFTIEEGEFTVVVGDTGAGKTTLLRLINGAVPHLTGGTLQGDVSVFDTSIRTHNPNAFATLVGVVPQDPLSSFVSDVVEDELAYTMECLGVEPATMRKHIEEIVDMLGLQAIRHRSIRTLSGGQLQRVAIASVLVAHPRVLVLDEPTSALDPTAADDVLTTLHRLVHDVGITVVMSEHRLERVIQYADRMLAISASGQVTIESPRDALAKATSVPPIVALAQQFGWSPVPLTIREARLASRDLRMRLEGVTPPLRLLPSTLTRAASLREVTVRYGTHVALSSVSLAVHPGEICALMGRNGAGKSTLLRALSGALRPNSGDVMVNDVAPSALIGKELPQTIGVVPQQPADLLLGLRVSQECRDADRDSDLALGTTRALLALLAPEVDDDAHPRDLSEGQRLCLALAIVLAPKPSLLLLDEPTRGLDYSGKARLAGILRAAALAGTATLIATHDVEFAAEIAHTVIVLADGEVVTHGDAATVLTTSPLFSPQVVKVLAPGGWLTVEDVRAATQG